MPHDLFISYSRRDNERCLLLLDNVSAPRILEPEYLDRAIGESLGKLFGVVNGQRSRGNRSSTGMDHPGSAGSASAMSPRRRSEGFIGSAAR